MGPTIDEEDPSETAGRLSPASAGITPSASPLIARPRPRIGVLIVLLRVIIASLPAFYTSF